MPEQDNKYTFPRQEQYLNEVAAILERTQGTADRFRDRMHSMGFYTEEEKKEMELQKLKAEMDAAQQRFNEQDLWNSEDPYEVYNAYETDPRKQAEFAQQGATTAGVLSTVATLPFTAGLMGWVPALGSTAGGIGGSYGGQKLGQWIDNKYNTNTTPWLSFAGGLIGGTAGASVGTWGYNQHLINKAFRNGQLKWGTPTSYTAYHQSNTPITKFKFPFKERWDVKTHGADPNGAFFTVDTPS